MVIIDDTTIIILTTRTTIISPWARHGTIMVRSATSGHSSRIERACTRVIALLIICTRRADRVNMQSIKKRKKIIQRTDDDAYTRRERRTHRTRMKKYRVHVTNEADIIIIRVLHRTSAAPHRLSDRHRCHEHILTSSGILVTDLRPNDNNINNC